MAVYVYRQGRMVNKETGEPMVDPNEDWKPVTPMTFGDDEGYQSPVTGEWIDGRRARRDDLKRHNCIDARELERPSKRFKNPEFVEKHGLQKWASDELR